MLFQTIHNLALMLDREQAGRKAQPTAGVVDSQTVKAPHTPGGGYDAGKKLKGRKPAQSAEPNVLTTSSSTRMGGC